MTSSLLDLLTWKGKTCSVLRLFRKSLRKDLEAILAQIQLAEVEQCAFWCVAKTIDTFLRISERVVDVQWPEQKRRLIFLSTALKKLNVEDFFLEFRFTENEMLSFRRLATLSDFDHLAHLCKEKRCLVLPQLTTGQQNWLMNLVWVKRVGSRRISNFRTSEEKKFTYPERGIISCPDFDRSDRVCVPGLHFTILINQSTFEDYGDHLLFMTLPLFADEEKTIPNELVISSWDVADCDTFRDHLKLRVKAVDVLGIVKAKANPRNEELE